MKDRLDVMKLRNASEAEVSGRVLELKRDLMNKRFELGAGSLKDTSSVRKARKAVARLKGFLTNKAAAGKPAAKK